jgi:hypothetical protein
VPTCCPVKFLTRIAALTGDFAWVNCKQASFGFQIRKKHLSKYVEHFALLTSGNVTFKLTLPLV